ncbi:MAG TPA: glycosyltransferase, partial [Pseudomonas sp.]|nr:glycosyltransferase [Pseudomonas sp.]
DLRELQRRSALFFAPLRYAGGSKVKILEAMAAGLPVITTAKGVSGLALNNGEHYLGSDDGDQLALSITQLLNQPWRMCQMSEAGRQFARQRHDWSIAAQQLETVHMRLIQSAPADVTQRSASWIGRSTE